MSERLHEATLQASELGERLRALGVRSSELRGRL